MPTSTNRNGFWTNDIWTAIDAGVKATMGQIRVAQKVFPTTQLANVTSVPADTFDPTNLSFTEGVTRPYIELVVKFPLTNGQVNGDPSGTTVSNATKLAARNLALAEDYVLLHGSDSATIPGGVSVESGKDSFKGGILGLKLKTDKVSTGTAAKAATDRGAEILNAITRAIGHLTSEVQAPPYALIAATDAWAEINGSVLNGAPTVNAINALVTGGIYATGAMPPGKALLVSLGGDPTTIYFSGDPDTEPTNQGSNGQYSFRIFERVQCVARDARAFVLLQF